MSTVPSGTRFIGISENVNLTERKSSVLNAETQPYTIQDLVDTIGTGAQGPQGVQGPAGPLGPVGPAGLEWQGEWVSGTSYVADDAVGYDGASWFCILATSGTTNPDVDTTHWALLASQGAQGIQGVQGPTGAQGPSGGAGTLQQTVNNGNTVAAGNFKTTLQSTGIISENTVSLSKIEIIPTQIKLIRSNGGLQQTNLYCSLTPTANRNIYLPDANGTIALTSDVTLQKAITGGNTISNGVTTMTVLADSIKTNDFLGGKIELVSTNGANPFLKIGLPASSGKTVTLTSADSQTASRTIKLPDADGTVALTSDIPTPAYTKYVCNFNATGTGAPVVQVLENTIGNIVWTRDGVGDYRGTLSGAFPSVTKTWFLKPNVQTGGLDIGAFLSRFGTGEIQLLITDSNQITPVDGTYSTSFEIRVYP